MAAGYLRLYDYQPTIQSVYFNQLTQGNNANRLLQEATAQAEMISYLVQKYDVTTEFAATTVFVYLTKYSANALVELNFPAFSASSIYALNALVTYNSQEYYCSTAVVSAGAFNPADWTLIGNQYDLYYLQYPYPLFNIGSYYKVGDIVYWKGKVYQCLIGSLPIGHEEQLQRTNVSGTSPKVFNVWPDNLASGSTYWGTGTPYSVTGVYPNGPVPANWSAGSYTTGMLVTYNGITWQALTNNNLVPGADIINWQPITWNLG